MARNVWVDLFKLLMAYFVIILHFAPQPFTRVAVSFFFMIAGYFAFSSKSFLEQKTRLKNSIIRAIKYVLIGIAIYFVIDFIYAYYQGTTLEVYIYTTVFGALGGLCLRSFGRILLCCGACKLA